MKKYQGPEIEVVEMETVDVITTSVEGTEPEENETGRA